MRGLLFLFFLPLCNCQVEAEYRVDFSSPVYTVGEDSEEMMRTDNVTVEQRDENTSCMFGYVEFLKDTPKELILELNILKENSGQFEVVNSHSICDLCKEMGNSESEYYPYFKYLGFFDECPIKKGCHEIRDFVVESENLGLKAQHCGRYEAEITLHRKTGDNCAQDRERILCMKIDFLIDAVE